MTDSTEGSPTEITDLNAPDDHGGSRTAPKGADAAGHEPDTVDVKMLAYAAVALVLAGAIAYGVIAVAVGLLDGQTDETPVNPMAAEKQSETYNERVRQLGRYTGDGRARLEGINEQVVEEAESMGTRGRVDSTTAENAMKLYPEDQRVEMTPELNGSSASYKWQDEKAGRVTVPMGVALRLALKEGNPLSASLKGTDRKMDGGMPPRASNGGLGEGRGDR